MSEDLASRPHVESLMRLGETDGWIRRSNRHLTGEPWPNAMATGAVILAILLAIVIAALLKHPLGWVMAVIVGIVGFRVRPWLWRRLALKTLAHALSIRDVHYPLLASLTVIDDEVLWVLGRVESRCPIVAISDVRRLGPYWVMTLDGHAALLPDRAFHSDKHRGVVLGALKRGLTVEAVARSPDLNRALLA